MSSELLTADINLIQRILPHRYPFLLVDKVLDIDGFQSSRGIKNVTMNEPHFQGHFPGNPIMPGVDDCRSNGADRCCNGGNSSQHGLTKKCRSTLWRSMAASFRRKVIPGDVLELKLTTVRGKPGGKVWKFAGIAEVDGEMAAEAQFTAMMDLPKE